MTILSEICMYYHALDSKMQCKFIYQTMRMKIVSRHGLISYYLWSILMGTTLRRFVCIKLKYLD